MRNTFVLFLRHPVYGIFVTAAQVDYKTQGVHNQEWKHSYMNVIISAMGPWFYSPARELIITVPPTTGLEVVLPDEQENKMPCAGFRRGSCSLSVYSE